MSDRCIYYSIQTINLLFVNQTNQTIQTYIEKEIKEFVAKMLKSSTDKLPFEMEMNQNDLIKEMWNMKDTKQNDFEM